MSAYTRSCLISVVALVSLLGCSSPRNTHELLNGVLWMQTSAEYRALSISAYRQAADALDRALRDPAWVAALEQRRESTNLPPAVILDLDETVLDNTGFETRLVRHNTVYDRVQWEEWVMQAVAPAVPGALEFLEYARSRGVAIFFVTNRTSKHKEFTRKNLQKLGIALPSEMDTVLSVGDEPHKWTGDKTSRRAFLASQYRILLLIGDDLGDFVSVHGLSPDARQEVAMSHREKWGVSWFLISNPLYGSWETSLYSAKLSDKEVLERKKYLLREGNSGCSTEHHTLKSC